MPGPPDIEALLEEALVLQWYVPVMVDGEAAPLVWVDPAERQDLPSLQQRMLALGTHITASTPLEIQAVYGATVTQWTYHMNRAPIAFFLSVQMDTPHFSLSPLELQAQQSSFVLGFNVLQQATGALLQAIIASRSLLLHFSTVPPGFLNCPRSAVGGAGTGAMRKISCNWCARVSPLDLQPTQ
jgi:hypothetical protein